MSKAQKKIRILLVDDHPEVLKQVRARLTYEQDFHVCSTASNMTLVEQSEVCQPDIVLIDPYTKEGFDFTGIATLRERFPSIQVIILTAIADTASQVELKKLGVRHILEKGVLSETLVKMVRESVMVVK